MRVTMLPFFSQQDKRQNKFRLASDSGVKLYAYIAGRLAVDHDVTFVLPSPIQCIDTITLPRDVWIERLSVELPLSNLDRRLNWDATWLRTLKCDLFMTQHEFLAYPLRCLRPDMQIIMECGIKPDTAWPQTAELFPLAWRSADLVHCNSAELAAQMPNSTVWKFGYADELASSRGTLRDIDVLFPARASSTEYSHHSAFVEAMTDSPLTVVMTDPTSFLRPHRLVSPSPLSREEYEDTLHRSKVVVGLTDNGYGGYAFIEAIAAGACPVALRSYAHLLTDSWPYFCDLHSIRSVVSKAHWAGVSTKVVRQVQENVSAYAYSVAWQKAKEDIDACCKRN